MDKTVISCLFLGMILVGCVQMRDYTGVKEGAFGLDIKKGFGEGAEKKDYYIMKNGEVIIIGDTKKEIVTKIGFPKDMEVTLEGDEMWAYNDKAIDLFFKEDRLNGWSYSRYKETQTEKKD
jgi:hypothetical protein